MGIKTRQEKANEIRDLITQINARVAELEEDDCLTIFTGKGKRCRSNINGMIQNVYIERKYTL